jgi:hypothetical protein
MLLKRLIELHSLLVFRGREIPSSSLPKFRGSYNFYAGIDIQEE